MRRPSGRRVARLQPIGGRGRCGSKPEDAKCVGRARDRARLTAHGARGQRIGRAHLGGEQQHGARRGGLLGRLAARLLERQPDARRGGPERCAVRTHRWHQQSRRPVRGDVRGGRRVRECAGARPRGERHGERATGTVCGARAKGAAVPKLRGLRAGVDGLTAAAGLLVVVSARTAACDGAVE